MGKRNKSVFDVECSGCGGKKIGIATSNKDAASLIRLHERRTHVNALNPKLIK